MSPIPGIIASSQTAATLSSYESIATATGTGSSNVITFSNIPSGYKSLQIRYIGKSTQGGTAARYAFSFQFNGATSSFYAYHRLSGNGSTVTASGAASGSSIDSTATIIPNSASAYANMHGVGILDIIDYTSTSKNKTVRWFAGEDVNVSAAGNIALDSGLWFPSTPVAITSIDFALPTGSWTTTSSFALYGIKG